MTPLKRADFEINVWVFRAIRVNFSIDFSSQTDCFMYSGQRQW